MLQGLCRGGGNRRLASLNCHTEDNSPKYRMIGNVVGLETPTYIFTDKVYSLFTTHHSLKRPGATHVALCDSVGSYFRHWCGAFTLAEVLVTLGIIGVVSAMTVPTLMQNYQRQSYVTQLHKVYNELSQALLRYQTDKNAINFKEAGLSGSEAYTEFQKNYFKVVQDCGTTQTPCFASSYKKMSGSSTNFKCKYGCMSLASGAAIGGYGDGTNGVYEIVVDVNGQKGPNIFGRDAFTMYIYTAQNVIDDLALKNPDDMNDSTWDSESSVPLTQDQREKNFQRACQGDAKPGEWHGCFGKILNDNWQMNY